MPRKRIAIYASGGGSNAQALFEHFQDNPWGEIVGVLGNRRQAGVWTRAEQFGLAQQLLTRETVLEGPAHLQTLRAWGVEVVVLAGYLQKLPDAVLAAYPNSVLNIHPSLLPRHGGPGMYGLHVHRAVLAAGDTHSGVTVHRVTPNYDEGEILLQAQTPVPPNSTPESLQAHLLPLEHRLYPLAVEWLCQAAWPVSR